MESKTSLSALYTYLKRFHLSDSLVLIGAINSVLKYGIKEFGNPGVAPLVIEWLKRNCKTSQNYLTIFIDTGRLARYLLLSGANDYRSDKGLNLQDDSFAIALNMTGAVYDTDLEKKLFAELGAAGLFARISQKQFPLQADQQNIIGRGYLLFVQLAEKFNESYSFEEKMTEYFGIGAYTFVATGMSLWIKTNGHENGPLIIDIPAIKDVASGQNQAVFLKLSSGTPQDYRRYIRGEQWKDADKLKDTYGAEPFYRMPAIVIDRSTLYEAGSYVVPQPRYFFDRASSGIFYLLADREQEIGRKAGHRGQNPFRKEFGYIYRKYAGIQLNQGKPKFRFIDMDNDFINHTGISIPDFALIQDHICVLFEIKTTLLKIEARSYFEPTTLQAEICEGSFKTAVKQLNTFGEQIITGKINDGRFRNINRVIKIIIGYEDVFALNTIVLPMIQKEQGLSKNDLQLGSVADLDAMGSLISQDFDIVQMIVDKVDDEAARYCAFIALWEKGNGKKNPVLKKAYNDMMDRMIGN